MGVPGTSFRCALIGRTTASYWRTRANAFTASDFMEGSDHAYWEILAVQRPSVSG